MAAIDSRTNKIVWEKESSPEIFGRGGTLNTAGGLLFHVAGDGNFQAYDAKTGDLLWQFQTGAAGAAGNPSTYEIDGEQYVAVPAGNAVWAFKLGGTLASRPAPKMQEARNSPFRGPIEDTTVIETAALEKDGGLNGNRYSMQENQFSPYRARVKVGSRVMWLNNGTMVHSIVAKDGSWTIGPLRPAESAYITFDKPGEYTYYCKEHPWSYGQLIVEAETSPQRNSIRDQATSSNSYLSQDAHDGFYSANQAQRGKDAFSHNCNRCHGGVGEGTERAPELVGTGFLSRWETASVEDLLTRIRTSMPPDNAGGLSREMYLDIVAFLLRSNDFPAGGAELNDDVDTLKSLRLSK
jgi:plastocyanin